MVTINVEHTAISIIQHNESNYISLTDMVKPIENGSALIEKWLRNKNTIEFLGIWEEMYNPSFNSPEFEEIKNQAGLNRFVLSVKQWVEKIGSKGILAKIEQRLFYVLTTPPASIQFCNANRLTDKRECIEGASQNHSTDG
jgi:hypothetical protein